MRAQHQQGRVRQAHEAIFTALATMDVDQATLRVDIGNRQILGFLKAQPTGIYDRQNTR